jgi:multicomponent K+:H+ antiporter subunit E
MKRVFPMPWMSAFLLCVWLIINQTLAPAHILLGAILAIVLPLFTLSVQSHRARIRNPHKIIILFFRVLKDIVASNIAVAKIVLGPASRTQHAGFMWIPLELKDPYGLAILSCVITSTPGTVWVEYDMSNSRLLIHVLDMQDETMWRDSIKQRYESLLLEIFQS